jgi:hypothetical protein
MNRRSAGNRCVTQMSSPLARSRQLGTLSTLATFGAAMSHHNKSAICGWAGGIGVIICMQSHEQLRHVLTRKETACVVHQRQ